ncbi:TetR family transcriptional regulator [Frankia sp. Ag45/Mut15]|uniref:TetR family transcriptional regulator n=1 Tax=Frankia umida TaxID=573489 RepID=A0ABT0JWS2_9ACTN|nr:TetR/AcrR family transcriptional regulator [Frankia umida]MCK9875448.1 TetR family transcriptional regulator [Frankia umida]
MSTQRSRREAVLDAAIEVLGSGGSRALTHRAVDRRAGVAEGTTSNYFRTRQALVAGVLARIARRESAPSTSPAAVPTDAEQLVAVIAERLRFLLGPGRTLTLARHALFLEAALDPRLRPDLLAESAPWWELGETFLRGLGVPDPRTRSRLLFAYLDGLLADQLARPSADFDPAVAVRTVMRGLLTP